ncbi:MAG TPA: phosphoribosylamine--glycine ligase [Clostridiaceae bacterium]|nr:phosphoribosylamine--glycine ligase [Clostridiaceae bacterium]
MKVLVVGGGGREHTLVWKIAQSPRVEKIYCAPGNGGISQQAECVPIKDTDIDGIVEFSTTNKIDLVVVGPDDPLAAGMVDALEAAGIRAFGPNKNAAIIEYSKAFSKNFMKKYGIPTARYEAFDNYDHAIEYLKHQEYPLYVKADGLARGKGAIFAQGFDVAASAVNDIMVRKVFGSSGDKVVIEECLTGVEVTVLAFTDGKTIVPMVGSQDHKTVFDNDVGLNTGGMGTFAPSKLYTPEVADYCMKNIYEPTIAALNKEGRKFKGVLYFGLILTGDGVKVIEYNSRFGDPETQVVLPLLKNDLVDIFEAVIDERLDEIKVEWENKAAVCVVAASGGYPEKFEKGYEIKGIEDLANETDIMVFHAGTASKDGKYYTNGGRVLGVTALGPDMAQAIDRAYKGIGKISFTDMHYRKDIGKKGL